MNTPKKKIILNALIPDEWVTKAVAFRLTGDQERADLRRKEFIHIACREDKCVMGNGVFAPSQLIRNAMTQLKHSCWIWILQYGERPAKEEQARMQMLMEHASIPYTAARVHVRKDQPNSRTRKTNFGIIVDITDASEALMLIDPGILERRRALRYNRDDPKL